MLRKAGQQGPLHSLPKDFPEQVQKKAPPGRPGPTWSGSPPGGGRETCMQRHLRVALVFAARPGPARAARWAGSALLPASRSRLKRALEVSKRVSALLWFASV